MRFAELLRTTVLLSAGAASLLAVVTLAAAAGGRGDGAAVEVAVGWWILAGLGGLWLGRGARASAPIASLLAAARTRTSLPEVNPAAVLLGRLWPVLLATFAAVLVGVVVPQVPGIAAGFALLWALAWRRQTSAVQAVEDRDGARFYVERTSPLRAIRLVRTPGFRADPVAAAQPAAAAESPPGG